MLLYSEYAIREGISDVWKVVVNKAKQVLQVTPLVAIKNLLARTRLGKFFVGNVDPDSVSTDASKGEGNIRTNIEWLLSQTKTKNVHEALNGFFPDGKTVSEVTQIDGEDMAEILADLMADISKETYNPKNEHNLQVPCFYGAIGIGKTTILKQVIREWNAVNDKKRGLILLDGGQLTSDSFLLPSLVDVSNTKGVIASVLDIDVDTTSKDNRLGPAPASFLPLYKPTGNIVEDEKLDAIANGRTDVSGISVDGGLIVVDEFFRADPSVFKNLMNIMQQRTAGAGEYVLGSKWAFILLSNRPCDDDEVAEAYDRASGAFFGRITPYLYVPTPKDWYSWAEKDGHVNKIVIDYIKQDESKFHKDTEDIQFTLDPRNWEGVGKIIDDVLERRYPNTLEGKKDLLDDVNKYTLLKSANDAVDTTGKKCPIFIKKIAAKIGVSETKEFCRYWAQILDKEINAANNTTEDEMDGKRGTVSDDLKSLMKEGIDDVRKIFTVKDSDMAENLGSSKFFQGLKVDLNDAEKEQPKKVTKPMLALQGLYLSIFGAYASAPIAELTFVTRRAGTGTYDGEKVIAFLPLKGTEEQALLDDAKALKTYISGLDTYPADYPCIMIANFMLLNSHILTNMFLDNPSNSANIFDASKKSNINDELKNALVELRPYLQDGAPYLKALITMILLRSGSERKVSNSDLNSDVFRGLMKLSEQYEEYMKD